MLSLCLEIQFKLLKKTNPPPSEKQMVYLSLIKNKYNLENFPPYLLYQVQQQDLRMAYYFEPYIMHFIKLYISCILRLSTVCTSIMQNVK